MNRRQFHLNQEIVLDARRAIWLPKSSVLAVADLHLGYAWAQRYRGMLCPVSGGDQGLGRLQGLQKEYRPDQVVLLGDIVHRAVPVVALEEELKQLVTKVGENSELIFVRGNHDKDLESLFRRCRLPIRTVPEFRVGPHLLLHGDGQTRDDAQKRLDAVREARGRIFMGHEHPAISIGDGSTTALKCPCFLISEALVVLPAFSTWTSGCEIRNGDYMSTLARVVHFQEVLPIMDERFLPLLERT